VGVRRRLAEVKQGTLPPPELYVKLPVRKVSLSKLYRISIASSVLGVYGVPKLSKKEP
jgi:hypothetical protein